MCNKALTYSGDLKDHLRIHSGDKPLKYEMYDMNFIYPSQFTRHKLLHATDTL